MPDDLNTILNEAIPRWAKLTGTKLGTNSFSFTVGSDSEFQSWDLQQYVKDLNESRSLDMTGTTAILILRGLFEGYVQEKSFSVHSLLYGADQVEATMEKLRSFHALITRPPCEEAAEAFRQTLRQACTHYGYDLGKLKKHLADDRALGELRLAAARSLGTLAVHQFTQGARDEKALQYNREIFEFSSINSFVHALRCQMVSGITLALIRGGDVYKAYFVLGLRNGETTTVLTDFSEGAHPEYHNVTRRPDRRLDERARLHWFPYRLLEGEAIKHRHKKDKTALVPIDVRAVPIETIDNLEAPEFIWLTLLFDLVAKKFDEGDYKAPELSYTGEMVVAPHALVGADQAIVVAGQYKPLVLPQLTVHTATPELAGNEKPLGHNAWLEERYAGRVPEILLDVVGERRALDVGKEATKLLPGKIKEADLPEIRRQRNTFGWGPDRRLEPLAPKALDPSYFGTARDVERTRAWYARVNLIKGVQRLATVEFAAKHKMIASWYRKRIERNMAFIWQAVATGVLVAPLTEWASREDHGFPAEDTLRWKEGNILRQKRAPLYNPFHPRDGVQFGGWDYDRRQNLCAIDPPTRANVFTQISPDNPRALALVMGIPEKKLPWPLQHWTTREPYTGNSILDRIDPQDSRLDNPWRHLDLSIHISLSKRAYNRLRKEHGLSGTSDELKEAEAR
ncbi:MAG TPA: hypothetical protein VLE97_10625 [Gaiellaceae bacterium]|nr:hypothetical protein [Gaiellaceae bacterium]